MYPKSDLIKKLAKECGWKVINFPLASPIKMIDLIGVPIKKKIKQ